MFYITFPAFTLADSATYEDKGLPHALVILTANDGVRSIPLFDSDAKAAEFLAIQCWEKVQAVLLESEESLLEWLPACIDEKGTTHVTVNPTTDPRGTETRIEAGALLERLRQGPEEI